MFIYGHHKMDSTTLVKELEQIIGRWIYKNIPSPGRSKERGWFFFGNKFRMESRLAWAEAQLKPGIVRRTSLTDKLGRERYSGHCL
jgi:hypothetical protein